MRPTIKRLPEEIINLISAGEVVERPVSVVKELVENSIDAGSTQITIELIDGGIKKIKVTDNGIGMYKDEIPLALMPHSTSKISSEFDLFNIQTLGFRGEALPSIASVSRFKISSMVEGDKLGFYYHFLNGKITSSGSVPMKKGTIVEVEDLFYNTPARYKHLSSNFTENTHIIDYIYKSALAHPEIAFTLINNQKIIYQTMSGSTTLELIGITYGMSVVKSMLAFKGENSIYQIEGYTSNNQVFRSNKNGITIFVNNRVIKNQNLIYAVTDAYKSVIPIGKYPITILKITCDPSLIDVNVHPSKLEIRFTDEQQLRNLITKSLTLAILEKPLIYEDILSKAEKPKPRYFEEEPKNEQVFDDLSSEPKTPCQPVRSDNLTSTESEKSDLSWDDFLEPASVSQPTEAVQSEEVKNESTIFTTDQSFFTKLHYIGQFHQTYLLLEYNNELYLIDQHAAAERVNYEKIVESLNNLLDQQMRRDLLIPIMVNFNITDLPEISLILPDLEKIGIKMVPFGGTTFKVESIPLWIKEGTEQEAILDIVNTFLNKRNLKINEIYDRIAKSVSCKKSLKAHMNIRLEEVNFLLEELDHCKMPYTCPHGRPTLIKFSIYEIEKLFKRVI